MRRFLTLVAVTAGLLAMALPASAHPLGNFTTNLHLGIDVSERELSLLLVVDMAEIPTFREPLDRNGDELISEGELLDYAGDSCARHRDELELSADAGDVPTLDAGRSSAALTQGSGGLQTLRLDCRYTARIPVGATVIAVHNRVYENRSGWSELVVTGADADGAGASSPTGILTSYPDTAPLQQRSATILLGTDVGAVAPEASPARSPVTGWLGTLAEGGGALAVVGALGLGITHALAPGHGKTLMAAYLVGRRGTAAHAAGLGLATAVSHTIGVGVLGVLTATASSWFQPESVYPWLTTASAGAVTVVGAILLVKASRGGGHHHGHDHDDVEHAHHHHGFRDGGRAAVAGRIDGWRSLAVLGLAGGMVPSASAVVLLLGAVAIGRPWFGLLLVASFGIGMSIALVGAGLAALKISDAGLRRLGSSVVMSPRLVSTIAAMAVTALGAILLWDAGRSLIG